MFNHVSEMKNIFLPIIIHLRNGLQLFLTLVLPGKFCRGIKVVRQHEIEKRIKRKNKEEKE